MASLIGSLKGNLLGRKAYQAHAAANRLLDAGKHAEAGRRFEEALRLYDEAMASGCDKVGVRMGYCLLLMRYGRLEEAQGVIAALQQEKGLSAADMKQLSIDHAVCQWKLGNLDEAIASMREAGRSGMTGTIYTTLGLFLVEKAARTGDFAEALDFCQKALDYDDEDADALDNMGELYLAMSRWPGSATSDEGAEKARRTAAEFFDKALERKPKLITALYYRAQMLAEDGDPVGARTLLERTRGISIGMLCPVSREQIDALLATLGS